MDLNLTGRRAVVTGASKGIGRAVSLALADEGVGLALCARDGGPLAEVAREIEGRGVPVHAAQADVTNESDVARFIRDAAAALGGIDILVNNAGGAIPGDFFSLTDEQWQADIDIKLFSIIRCIRAAHPYLKESDAGRIINIGAVFAHYPKPDFLAATTLRAAGHNLGKALAMQFATDGILVNTVHVGYIETPQWQAIHQRRAPDKSWADFLGQLAANEIPLGRFGKPEEVADLVAFLASDRSAYITGVDIDVAGGMGIST
jgi:NAD(P)-dependent dehydrogenase (short-subunit alcohol dehydrogenase family)